MINPQNKNKKVVYRMKGIIRYYTEDPEIVNSTEGWALSPKTETANYICYQLTEDSLYEIKNFDKEKEYEVEYELLTNCHVDHQKNVVVHDVVAKLLFNKDNKQKLFLIDIDGTICDDIRNEESELYPTAKVFPKALETINKWYDEGNVITFFTARESKDREVTTKWLDKHGFKYHGLVMDKPRINDQQEYVWIDNKKVRAVTYLGTWSDLKEVDAKIQIFG